MLMLIQYLAVHYEYSKRKTLGKKQILDCREEHLIDNKERIFFFFFFIPLAVAAWCSDSESSCSLSLAVRRESVHDSVINRVL